MSEENVEVVRRIYEGWEAGDFNAGVAAFDPHVMFVIRPEFPEFGVFVGLEGGETFIRRWLEQWERATIEVRSLQPVGDTVVAEAVLHQKGRVSGIEGDTPYFQLFTFRGGKIIRIEAVMDQSDALKAAGLSESESD